MLLRLRTFSYLHYYKTSSVKNISHTIQHIVYVYSCTLNGRPTHILPMHWITIIKWVFLVCENEDSLGRVFHRSANIIKHNVGIYIERERKTEKGVQFMLPYPFRSRPWATQRALYRGFSRELGVSATLLPIALSKTSARTKNRGNAYSHVSTEVQKQVDLIAINIDQE